MEEPNRPQTPAGQPAAQAEKVGRAARESGAGLAQQAQGRAADVARKAGDRTNDLTRDAQERAGKVADAAQGRAAEVGQKAREGAVEIAATVQDRLGDAGERKDQAADAMGAAAGQAQKAADKLREADQRWLSEMVGAGADELGAFAEMIRSNDFNGIVQRVRGVARRQPALFAGASVAVGFALARMARVAMEEPSRESTSLVRSARITASARDTSTPTPPAATYSGTIYNG